MEDDSDIVYLPKIQIKRIDLLFLLINLLLPIILDNYAIIRDMLVNNILSGFFSPLGLSINPLFDYKLSFLLSIVFAVVFGLIAIMLFTLNKFKPNFSSITAMLSAALYALYTITFGMGTYVGEYIYTIFAVYVTRLILVIGGAIFIAVILMITKKRVQLIT